MNRENALEQVHDSRCGQCGQHTRKPGLSESGEYSRRTTKSWLSPKLLPIARSVVVVAVRVGAVGVRLPTADDVAVVVVRAGVDLGILAGNRTRRVELKVDVVDTFLPVACWMHSPRAEQHSGPRKLDSTELRSATSRRRARRSLTRCMPVSKPSVMDSIRPHFLVPTNSNPDPDSDADATRVPNDIVSEIASEAGTILIPMARTLGKHPIPSPLSRKAHSSAFSADSSNQFSVLCVGFS
ncbi:hypothetical protein AXG93_1449s1000 [Marchantia polymorpha subsp. ruderalis]|uniref:Uncharacterized protein n=1 Tax=Marchantia polymorpha subsp. ruderalis TaxID=1480154 RepID=A0A176VGZ2_MARPO|nr:hypothetical protein AXG93_1449s1000 [Marchantia polymorpha subsp. ruderalis]